MTQAGPVENVVVKLGKDLTAEELDFLNRWRLLAFDWVPSAHIPLDPRPGTENYSEIFFLARTADGRVVAFGRFHNITARFMGRTYPIFGLATVASVEQGRGYGRVVVQAMRDHAVTMGRPARGFTTADITPFYVKCGIGVVQGGSVRFVYEGPYRPGPPPGRYDMLYVQASDGLIDRMAAFPDENVRIPRPIW